MKECVKLSKLQLGVYHEMYRLEQALVSDAYIAGYMSKRVLGIACIAAGFTGGLEDRDLIPIVANTYPRLFGRASAEAQLLFIRKIVGDTVLNEHYMLGQNDAFEFHQYLIGAKDFTKHVAYPQLRAEIREVCGPLDEQPATECSLGHGVIDALALFESRTLGKRLQDGNFNRTLSEQEPKW
ncbi:MAG TPA: hypothetical protein VIC31_05855 [Rudaea sp.]